MNVQDPRLALLSHAEAVRDPRILAPLLEGVEELEDELEAILRAFIDEKSDDALAARLAFLLLAEGQRFETWRSMLAALRMPAARLEPLFGDDLIQTLPLAMANMSLADFPNLKALVRDRSLAPAARHAAFTTLVIEASRLPNRRTETIALLAELLAFAHEEPRPEFLWKFLGEAVALTPNELATEVEDAVTRREIPSEGPQGGLGAFRDAMANPRKPWWEGKLPFHFARSI